MAGLDVRRSADLTTRLDGRTSFTVTVGGEPVRDLQPMHDAPGHAVVVRPADLGLAHLHAEAGSGRGPRLEFAGGVPEPGTYAVFVEFTRPGRLHVAAFTVPVRR